MKTNNGWQCPVSRITILTYTIRISESVIQRWFILNSRLSPVIIFALISYVFHWAYILATWYCCQSVIWVHETEYYENITLLSFLIQVLNPIDLETNYLWKIIWSLCEELKIATISLSEIPYFRKDFAKRVLFLNRCLHTKMT